MALPSSVIDRENKKFVEDDSGDVAVRTKISDTVAIEEQSPLDISTLATSSKQDDILDELQKDEATQIAEDSGDSNITYIGLAEIGTATGDASWKILKIDATSGASFTYADSNNSYDNVWDNREALSYG